MKSFTRRLVGVLGSRSFGTATERLLLASMGGEGAVTLSFREDSVAVMTIDNRAAANALSCGMMVQLAQHVDTLQDWREGRGLIVMGSQSMFCAGAHLGSHSQLFTEKYGRAMSTLMMDTLTRMRALPLVSVAAISGAAVGGGAELATACDYRVWEAAASMQWVHASRGVVPGWGGLRRLHGIVGRSHALFIAGAGKRLSAQQAAHFGLADAVLPSRESWASASDVSDAQTLIGAIEFLRPFIHEQDPQITTAPLRAIKRTLHAIDAGTDAEGAETNEFAALWGGDANRKFLDSWSKRRLAIVPDTDGSN
jgi:ethylmalonyl-CoA/methylmalonyl-CoA decarboxylase